jgi:hypothetical protein
MFARLPEIEEHVSELIASSQYADALVNIFVGVHNHMNQPDTVRKFLYYPKFDQQIEYLADVLANNVHAEVANNSVSSNTLIVASELYQVGGHSRVVCDIVREIQSPTIVLTDMFWRFKCQPHQLNWLYEACDNATIVVLSQLTPWAKCKGLFLLTQQLQPSNIFFFNHHQDPIPFIGTLGHRGSRKTLFHHCDHAPSLGNSLSQVRHVDFVEEMAGNCARLLERQTVVLPLYVEDLGEKVFGLIGDAPVSAVTSGTHVKYRRTGEMALQSIAQTVLTSLNGKFFHIGEIDADWVSEIRTHLFNVGIAPERFIALGQVQSVWETLKNLDAHIYVGSAPIGGGRAAIEAQGCGYPVTFFRVLDQGPAIASDSLYASKHVGWFNLAELGTTLQTIVHNHSELSFAARAHYEQHYSHNEFVRVLRQIMDS